MCVFDTTKKCHFLPNWVFFGKKLFLISSRSSVAESRGNRRRVGRLFTTTATTNPGSRREIRVCGRKSWKSSKISHGHRRPSSFLMLFSRDVHFFREKLHPCV